MRLFLFLITLVLGALEVVTSLSSGSSSPSVTGGRRSSVFPGSLDVTDKDVGVLVRQTGQASPGDAAIGIPKTCHCRHNFPQVFTLDPLPQASGKRMNSGLLKLTCPLLVLAVDGLEDEGMIQSINAKLSQNENLQKGMKEAHAVHAVARKEVLQNEIEIQVIRDKLGERGTMAFLNAGVAAASFDAISDVKCLHAWLGDFLFRGAELSPIGAMVANELSDRGIDLTGDQTCSWRCDSSSASASEPPKPRNKQRLKSGKETARRRRKRQSMDGSES